MKKSLIILLNSLFVCAVSVNAQAVQDGIVLEYHGEKPKTPLSMVAITAANASSTASDKAGKFTLNFRSLKAGDNIQFRRIEKSGYEIMNKEAVEAMRVGRNKDDKPLEIILCKTEELNNLRDGYRTIAAKLYEKRLKEQMDEIKRLRDENKLNETDYNVRINEMEEAFANKLSDIETYIDKFARIDLSTLDEDEKIIIELVREGKIEEAIARYDDLRLTDKLKQTIDAKRQLQEAHGKVSKAEEEKAKEVQKLTETNEKIKEVLKK